MKDLRTGINRGQEHVRGTSREHLRINFSSSGSSGEDEMGDVSLAASDIGMLPLQNRSHPQPQFASGYGYARSASQVPPVRAEAKAVGQVVPLVDLREQDNVTQDESASAQSPLREPSWFRSRNPFTSDIWLPTAHTSSVLFT